MKSAFKDAQAASLFNGWDELGAKSSSWKIEREQPAAEMGAPFFPDQNGGVYEQLLASFPVMMHAMDGSGRLSAVNRQWCATLGYHPSEVIGRSFNELLTAQSRSHLITQIYPKYLQAGNCRNEEMFVHRKDGSLATVLLSMNAYRGDKGRIERSICLLHDITERKIAEIASSRADYRYRGGFINAPYGMALVSPTGQVETCNPALAALLGRKENEVVTMALDELLDKSDRSKIVNGLRLLMGGEGKPLDLDANLVAADGRRIHCQARIAPMKNDKGEVELLVVQLSDIPDRKVAAPRSQQSQKMEAIGQLTGGLAHDFNNLLTIILGNLQLVEEKMQGDGLVTRRLRESIDAANKGSELTRQLLAVARPTQIEPRHVSVTSVVEGMEALITRALGDEVQVSFEYERGLPDVYLDQSQLEPALLNLAINARDAMPRGGKLAFQVRRAAASAGGNDLPAGPCIEVCVADSGEGTAVSITLPCQAAGNVDSGHAGAVAAPSLEMPAWMEQAIAEGDGSSESATPAARRRKILVVEDQEAVRAVACGFLSDFGYDVVEAEDGFQALSRLQEDQDIDLMFSDIVMPGGMNGFDLAQAAAGMRPDIKVVHTSGYPKGAMVHQDEPRFRQGFIIMKPYRREELQKIIADAFANQ